MPDDDRTFITVHDGMPDHPKFVGLSDRAFRRAIELWCYSSRYRTNGRIPKGVWTKAKPAVRRELMTPPPGFDNPLYIDDGAGGALVHDYLEHQRSSEEIAERIEKKKKAGAKGNHERWHVGPKGKPQPDCPLCQDRVRGSDSAKSRGSQLRSHPVSQLRSQPASEEDRKTSPDTEGFLRNPQTDTDLSAGQDLGGVSGKQRGGDRTPPQDPRTERTDSLCGLHADDDRPCRRCRDQRLADEQEKRDAYRGEVVASIPGRRCRMCDADEWLLEVGRFLPVSPAARCDHETDHATQVRRAREAS